MRPGQDSIARRSAGGAKAHVRELLETRVPAASPSPPPPRELEAATEGCPLAG
ncbi:hypothetical protein GQ55_5G145500 [Panicum hallii var. hallii]|uniref:Uncharacterized protein n=1 Tax=Panicum hallii var. hallii TaxID=1504633 RepID=A0A2T7DGA6_9POAL|nr:hypothetical protein GQ55_5G145500 [Panicum hallii var. hallii]